MNNNIFDDPQEFDGSESRINLVNPPVNPAPEQDEMYTKILPSVQSQPETGSDSQNQEITQPIPQTKSRVSSSTEYPQEEVVNGSIPKIQPLSEIDTPIGQKVTTPQKRKRKRGCMIWVLLFLLLLILPAMFLPFRVTTLVLGIDRPPKDTWIGRSDTMILTTLPPYIPKISLLSIPRDLWITLPNHYENRINTAHYFAELETPNSGMQATKEAVELNFGIDVDYVVRIKFDGFVEVVDALGGVTVDLPTEMSGLPAGKNHLNGTEALKFVRDRTGSDDFFRQQRGQLFLSAAAGQMLNPLNWWRFPAVIAATSKAVETDLPVWLWPRVVTGFTFSAISGFDSHTFDRNAVTPWITDEGAQVLLPNWELMNPLIDGVFK